MQEKLFTISSTIHDKKKTRKSQRRKRTLNLIKTYVQKPKADITLNRKKYKTFLLIPRTRQNILSCQCY